MFFFIGLPNEYLFFLLCGRMGFRGLLAVLRSASRREMEELHWSGFPVGAVNKYPALLKTIGAAIDQGLSKWTLKLEGPRTIGHYVRLDAFTLRGNLKRPALCGK